MTTISGPVKPVYYRPDARQSTGTVEPGQGKAVYWLISLAALVSLLVGVLCLHESVKSRTADAYQLDFVVEGGPSHVGITIDEAFQGVSVRH
jgi:hypothetical protein